MGYFLTTLSERPLGRPLADPKTHTPFSRVKERGHRFYSPELGRWLSRDPIGERGGLHLYVFVGNAAISRIDPFGLDDSITGEPPQNLVDVRQRILSYLDMNELSTPVAAQLLRHYLGGSGETVNLDASWMMGLRTTQEGVERNKERIKGMIRSKARQTPNGGSQTVHDWWDALVVVPSERISDRDALYALQGYTITTFIKVKMDRQGDCIDFKGDIEHLAWDWYDFNANSRVPIPGAGWIECNDLIAMTQYGLTKSFWVTAWMNQNVSGRYEVRWFRDSLSINFSDLAAGQGSAGVYDAVVSTNPRARRLVTLPPPRGGRGP